MEEHASTTGSSVSKCNDWRRMKTMNLYSVPERRVRAELAVRGLGDAEPLKAETVAEFDSMHYGGNKVVDECIAKLKLAPLSKVLDVGSGLGGPARRLASAAGWNVVALELQARIRMHAHPSHPLIPVYFSNPPRRITTRLPPI